MKNLTIYFIVLAIVIIGFLVFGGSSRQLGLEITTSKTGVSSSVVINGTTTKVFSADTANQFRSISNIGTSTAYLHFDSAATTATSTTFAPSTGYPLYTSSTNVNVLELFGDKLFNGKVWATTASGESTTLSTLEI